MSCQTTVFKVKTELSHSTTYILSCKAELVVKFKKKSIYCVVSTDKARGQLSLL